MHPKLALTITVSCFFIKFSNAQQFGGTPSSVKWKQVNTPSVRVIFPTGFDSTAKRVASVTNYLNQHTSHTTGDNHRKISIVFHPYTTIANAYVSLSPWRSEFNLTPQQNSFELGSLPWPDQLSIHEYRHVQQFMNYRKGLSKLMYYIFGEDGQAVANSAAIPNWFFEGDAVFQETSVSEQGRGRLPFFFKGYRSLWAAGKGYSYMKLRNGSYRNYTPDHYQLGYLLVGYGRDKYGQDFWKNVTDDAVRYKSLFYPLQHAVKKYSGISFRDFVQNARAYYTSIKDSSKTDSKFITETNTRYVVDYVFPYAVGKDSLLVLKKTYRTIPAWYWITPTGEKKIKTKSISSDDDYTYRNGKIIYAAFEPDARWGWRDFSVIRILDLATGNEKRLSTHSKYFAPDLSVDEMDILTAEVLSDQRSQLCILDASNGKLKYKVPNPQQLFYTYPRYFDKDHAIACVRTNDGMMSLALINLRDGAAENLTPLSYQVKGFPMVKGDMVLFSAGNGYEDDAFAVNVKTKKISKLTTEELGAYQPTIDEKGRLFYSNFSADGYRLKEKQLAPKDWEPVMSATSVNAGNLYVPEALQQNGGNALDKIPQNQYTVSKYSKGFRLFNFHSWRPYYDQPDWSFTLYGENVLNTFQSSLYYSYNENERSHKVGFSGVYGALFPWITGGISYTFNRRVSDTVRTYTWNELNSSLGLSIPLNFSSGRWFKSLSFGSSINNKQVYYTGFAKDSLTNPHFNYVQSTLSWVSQTQKGRQNIFPHFAQTVYLQHRVIINNYYANQFLASGSLYFRGIGVNHNIVVSAAYQTRDTANEYRFDNNFPFARGYTNVDAPRMWKWSVNYHFPICYPDWGFGQIVYFSRIRANIFYDDAKAKSLRTGTVFDFRTVGSELFFDTQWWNEQPLSIGIRYSHLLDENLFGANTRNVWEIILPVIITR